VIRVSEIGSREGLRAFGATTPQHVIIWENLMDAKTVLLTANTETVYALAHLNLRADGPTVVEAPPHMLGLMQDGLQRYIVDVGPLGPDKGKGGKFLILPPARVGNGRMPRAPFRTSLPALCSRREIARRRRQQTRARSGLLISRLTATPNPSRRRNTAAQQKYYCAATFLCYKNQRTQS
jgi:hypothetical protein